MPDQTADATAPAPVWAPRKLVVCCDGTWNEPYKIGKPTNVVKMARAILPKDANEVAQLIYYHPGVGTGNVLDRFIGGTMGVGLAKNVQSAYDFLAANYCEDDKIYLFGFSRGAYTARSIAGLIGQVGGLLRKTDMDLFPFVFEIYRSREHRAALGTKQADKIEAAIRAVIPAARLGKHCARLVEALCEAYSAPVFFIGVWDTVGALGVPSGWLRWIGQSRYNFHDTGLSERIRFAYHALAIDERRKSFEPSLWTRRKGRGSEPGAVTQTLEQVWFAGVHSNVGGSYDDAGLSDIAFLWMVNKAKEAAFSNDGGTYLPLAFDEHYLDQHTERCMGLLEDSGGSMIWKISGLRERAIMAPPAALEGVDQETCESIHWSAAYRLQCTDDKSFKPFPYAPNNLNAALQKNPTAVAALSDLEKQYHPWPEPPAIA